MLISPCIVNQLLEMFQQDDTFFVQYFIPCKQGVNISPETCRLMYILDVYTQQYFDYK
jgi:hypothetical protein